MAILGLRRSTTVVSVASATCIGAVGPGASDRAPSLHDRLSPHGPTGPPRRPALPRARGRVRPDSDLGAIRVEGDAPGDLGDGRKRLLVAPDHVDDLDVLAEIDAEIGGVPFVGAIRDGLAAAQDRLVEVSERDVLDGRMARFPE